MAPRIMRLVSPAALAAAAALLSAGATPQAPKAVFKPDYEARCPCDHSIAETLLAYPQCSLCLESEFHPPHEPFFFVKDINPSKPNRWLILPRAHDKGMQNISDIASLDAAAFWAAAVRKGEELWGKQWGLAVNGDLARSQCHAHVHIGKLLDGVEENDWLFKMGLSRAPGKPPVIVAGPGGIRAPDKGAGFWIHPVDGGLHLHVEDITALSEFVLMR